MIEGRMNIEDDDYLVCCLHTLSPLYQAHRISLRKAQLDIIKKFLLMMPAFIGHNIDTQTIASLFFLFFLGKSSHT